MTAIKVPPLGESITEATVSRWLKNEGDPVAVGETLVELDTDKITVEVPAMMAGVLTKRAHAEGDVVKVDDFLAEIDENAAPVAGPQAPAAEQKAPAPAPQAAAPASPPEQATAPPAPAAGPPKAPRAEDVRVSPAAQRVAAEKGIDVSTVQGTGRGGVVSKPDVIERAEQPPPQPPRPQPMQQPRVDVVRPTAPSAVTPGDGRATAERETREKMSTRRKRIAENLLQSQQATAHLTTFNEIDMSAVVALRERLKERVEKEHGVKLSFMPFFVKAASIALEQFPTVNALVDGDTIVYRHYVNMGIAVAVDAGLVVPNIKDADRKSMLDVSRDIAELAKRARDTKLTMDDLTGGTFTITNGGVFGSLISTPIINYPQVAILGLHKTQDRPVAISGKVEIRPMMYVALSYDHRIIEGQHAVQFLVRVKELMEDPASMLVN
jgi:2-oxoglutarate dehydrogenase E2 component (dihydrolipoamide succinyltransferase)